MNKIALIRSDRFGEFLLSLPAIKLVRENFPNSTIYLLAQESNIELIKGVDFIDRFIELKEDCFRGLKGSFRLAAILNKEKIDCLVVLNPKKEFHFASCLSRVPLRVGYDRKWGWCLNKKIKDKKYLEDKHEVDYNLELVSLICKNSVAPEVNLKVDQKSSLEFLNISGSYLLLHPFTSNPLKAIADEFWQVLVKKLKEKGFSSIALIGSKAEEPKAKTLAKQLGVADFSGKLNLRNLAAFLKHNCRALVGLDSGPLHLASLLKVPVAGLFTVSNPKRWGPYKTSCLVLQGKSLTDFTNQVDKIVNFVYG